MVSFSAFAATAFSAIRNLVDFDFREINPTSHCPMQRHLLKICTSTTRCTDQYKVSTSRGNRVLLSYHPLRIQRGTP